MIHKKEKYKVPLPGMQTFDNGITGIPDPRI